MDAGDGLCVSEEAFHLCLGAAVAELQVVQHRVVLLGKSLISCLKRGHIRAHFVGVIGHVCNGHICILDGLFRVAAKGSDQTRRKARDRLHVFVCRKTGSLIGICSISLHCLRRILEEGVNTADKLLIICVGRDYLFAELDRSGTGSNNDGSHCYTDCFQHFTEAFKLTLGFFCRLAGFLDFFAHVVGTVSCGIKLPLHIIQSGLGIV